MFSIRSLLIIATALPVPHPLALQHTLTCNGPALVRVNFITHDWIRTTWRPSLAACGHCVCVCLLCAWLWCLSALGEGSSLGNPNHLKTLQTYYVWLLNTCKIPHFKFEVKTPESVTVCNPHGLIILSYCRQIYTYCICLHYSFNTGL